MNRKQNLIGLTSIGAFVVIVSFFCCLLRTASADPVIEQVNYFVGNSYSWDILNGRGLDNISGLSGGTQFRTSQQIHCGSSLTNTIASPTDVCAPTGYGIYDLGQYQSAFTHQIDNLVLQPFYGSTLQQEIGSIEYLIDQLYLNAENHNTQVFIYETWGYNLNAGDFLTNWNTHQASLTGGFTPSASTYAMLYSELKNDGYDVDVIPAGQAFAMAAEKLKNGSIGNLQADRDLFRDGVHGSNAGRYLAALTAYSAISGVSPENITDATEVYPFALDTYGIVADQTASSELRSIAALVTGTAIPEPATGVLALGFFMLVASQRRRRV